MAKYPVPNLGNATVSHMMDEAVRYRRIKAEADFYDKLYSTAIKARMGSRDEELGENYIALLTVSYTSRISPDLCRQFLDDETLAKVTVEGETVTLRFAKRLEPGETNTESTTRQKVNPSTSPQLVDEGNQ